KDINVNGFSVLLFRIALSGISILAALFTAQLSAQVLTVAEVENSIKKDGKYVILVRNAEHLQASVITAAGHIKDKRRLNFQIVGCGPLVNDVAGDEVTREIIGRTEKE